MSRIPHGRLKVLVMESPVAHDPRTSSCSRARKARRNYESFMEWAAYVLPQAAQKPV